MYNNLIHTLANLNISKEDIDKITSVRLHKKHFEKYGIFDSQDIIYDIEIFRDLNCEKYIYNKYSQHPDFVFKTVIQTFKNKECKNHDVLCVITKKEKYQSLIDYIKINAKNNNLSNDSFWKTLFIQIFCVIKCLDLNRLGLFYSFNIRNIFVKVNESNDLIQMFELKTILMYYEIYKCEYNILLPRQTYCSNIFEPPSSFILDFINSLLNIVPHSLFPQNVTTFLSKTINCVSNGQDANKNLYDLLNDSFFAEYKRTYTIFNVNRQYNIQNNLTDIIIKINT